MQKPHPMASLGAFLGICAGVLLIAACESSDNTAGASFLLEPAGATLQSNDTYVVLQAVGGNLPIAWSVSDTNLGAVSGSGDRATYTRVAGAFGANTVRARDGRAYEATSVISQPTPTPPSVPDVLVLNPASATLNNNGDTVVFIVSGGDGPYSWRLVDTTRGSIRVRETTQAAYTRTTPGPNTVQVYDGKGRTAVALITQPDTAPLAVSPASATVSTNGILVLSAVGGSGSYTWSIASGAGTLNPATGSSTVFTSVNGAVTVVQLTDGSSTVFSTISKQ